MSVRFSPWLVLLALLTAVGPMSIDLYLPSFPQLEAELGASGGSAEWTLAAFFIALALGQLVYGPLSDRWGRKPPLYVGLVLYILASLGCATATSLYALMAWRFLQGLGGCAGMVIARASVRDRLEGGQAAQAFSLMVLVMGLAPMLAPLAGGWLVRVFGWRSCFLVLVGFGLLLLAGVRYVLPETRQATPATVTDALRNYAVLARDPEFRSYALGGGLLAAGMFAYISGSPAVFLELHGMQPHHFGLLFGVNALGFVLASQVNARLLQRFTPRQLLQAGATLALLSPLAMLSAQLQGVMSLPLMAGGLFLYLVSLGFTNPNATALALASQQKHAGAASALLGTGHFFLGTVTGAILGALPSSTALPLLSTMAICAVLAFFFLRKVTG